MAINLGGLGSWFSGLSPQAQAALMTGGFTLGGSLLAGMGDEKAAEQANQFDLQKSLLNNQTTRMATAAGMMGSSPLQFQQDRAKLSMLGAALSGQQLPGFSVTPPDFMKPYVGNVSKTASDFGNSEFGRQTLDFLRKDSMANAEAPYWSMVSQLNPSLSVPDLASMGYGPAANQSMGTIAGNRATALNQSLMGPQGGSGSLEPPKGYEYKYNSKSGQYELKKKGGGFWSKLGKIASVAIPIAAAPFTGGASLAAISAGAGALGGLANGGGLKGALMGAGMGAATGALGGFGKAEGAPFSWGGVGKALTAPGALMQVGGAGVGGKIGTGMQLAGMFMPHYNPNIKGAGPVADPKTTNVGYTGPGSITGNAGPYTLPGGPLATGSPAGAPSVSGQALAGSLTKARSMGGASRSNPLLQMLPSPPDYRGNIAGNGAKTPGYEQPSVWEILQQILSSGMSRPFGGYR